MEGEPQEEKVKVEETIEGVKIEVEGEKGSESTIAEILRRLKEELEKNK